MSDPNDRPPQDQPSQDPVSQDQSSEGQSSEGQKTSGSTADFAQKVMKGGLYLAMRQLVSVGLSIVSVLVVARKLGPADYGVLVNALGIYYFVTWTGRLGLHVYLIQKQDLADGVAAQILAFLNWLNVGLAIALVLIAPAIGGWTGKAAIADLVRWLPLAIATDLAASVSIAMLERRLAFAQVGLIEMGAQFANYLITLPLVFAGWRYWGPIAGLSARGLTLLLLAQFFYPVRWQWRWQWSTLRPALRYGLSFSLADWVSALKALTIPVVVTPIAGVEAAGLVSIAIRLTEQLSVLRLVIRRMSISIMARLGNNTRVILSTISRGMAYQALMVGAICSAFACLDGWIIPLLFGDDWLRSTHIFPFVALSAMVRAMFDLHAGALHAVNRNLAVTRVYIAYIALLWVGCWLMMPRFGLWGYGFAELLTVLSYVGLHLAIVKLYGSPRYSAAAWLTVAAMVPILGSLISPVIGIVAFCLSYSLVLLIPTVRVIPMELANVLRRRSQPVESVESADPVESI